MRGRAITISEAIREIDAAPHVSGHGAGFQRSRSQEIAIARKIAASAQITGTLVMFDAVSPDDPAEARVMMLIVTEDRVMVRVPLDARVARLLIEYGGTA